MSTDAIDWKVWQRPEIVDGFTARRRAGILGGDVQIETLLRLVAAVGDPAPVVLDIGCGDGVLIDTVLSAFPGARGVAVDGSEAMLEKAAARLDGKPVTRVAADFNDPAWTDALPERRFDAIVSGFAIHHSDDDRKQSLYAELFGLLAPGGVLVNVEHVASATPRGEGFWEAAWCENVARTNGGDYEAIIAEFRNRPDRFANRLTSVETQLAWLREIGFIDVDCYWKHFELAVLAGFREA